MNQFYCANCSLMKARLHQFVSSYEDLIASKESQIICSHRIIKELQQELKKTTSKLKSVGMTMEAQQNQYSKVMYEKNEALEHYRKRQIDLLEKVKKAENELFQAKKEAQDKLEELNNENINTKNLENKSTGMSLHKKNDENELTFSRNIGNETLKANEEASSIFNQSSIGQYKVDMRMCSLQKDSLQLKVCQDKLKMMDLKHKMALLKAVEAMTLK